MPRITNSDRTSDRSVEEAGSRPSSSGGSPPADQTVKVSPAVEAHGGAALGHATRSPESAGSLLRWWLAVAAGFIVSIPLAWLLSYAGMLLLFLGLFFFALFGLIIGAVVYRIASPGRPYGRAALIIGTTIIVLFMWTFSLVKESRDFPSDMAGAAAANPRLRLHDRSIEGYRAEVAEEVREFLRERYPPGGTIGYIRWITTSGELSSVDIASVKRLQKRSQCKHWWVIRVILSLGLLAFGVGSQTLLLKSK